MKLLLRALIFVMLMPAAVLAQCTTTNATSCVCQNGTTQCDLLPDIKVARPPMLVNGSSGYLEYPQVCNPSCNGNDGRLRLSVSSPNVGLGPLEVRSTPTAICGTDTFYNVSSTFTCPNGQPLKTILNQRVYRKNGNTMSYTDRVAGTMTYHPSHGHMHVDDWGIYTLRTATSDPNPLNWPVIGTGSKLAFCLMDYGSCSTYNGHCTDSAGNTLINSNFPNYGLGGGAYGCSQSVQGISSGYTDIYYQSLDGMWINIPPGVCNGNYWIVVQLDPYNYFLESDETNNVLATPITLTQQGGSNPVITASGSTSFCQGGSVSLTASSAQNYLWSNGATTQSITVTQSGSYSVTVNSGTSCVSTSNPATVTVSQIPVTAAANPTSVCPGEAVSLSATATTGGTTNLATAFSNTTAYSIPDNNANGVSSPIAVSGINPATINSSTVVSVKVNITHTYAGDIQLVLISPSQNSIILSNRRGGSGDNYTNTVFTTSAANFISSGAAPFTGSFKPEGSFNSLTGNVNGTWLLKVIDLASTDVGTIQNWTLTLNNVVPTTVSYAWSSNPAGFSASGSTVTAFPQSNSTYTVTATESGTGCQNSASVAVTMNSSINVTTNTPSAICGGGSVTLNASGANDYVWSPATGLNTTTGSTVTASPAQTTTYTVVGTQGACTDTALVTVVVASAPSSPASFSGNLSGCAPFTATYTASAVSGATSYSWSVPSGMNITSGGSGSSISVSAGSALSGSVCVSAINACGTSSSKCSTVTVLTGAPVAPTSLTGNLKACPNDVIQYTCNTVTGATTYNWSIPANTTILSGAGTNSISLRFNTGFTSGTLAVNASNSCGTSASLSRSITLNTPTTPAAIIGPANGVCRGIHTYSVTAVTGVGYTWTMPTGATILSGQGTSTVQVQFSTSFTKGTLSVRATNGCGTSTSRSLSVNAAVSVPGVINGPSTICKGAAGVAFSVTPVYGATSHNWTAPSGATFASGQGSASVSINFSLSAASGYVRVAASNACGTSSYQRKSITLTTCPRITDGSSLPMELSLIPNPATEQVELRYNANEGESAQITIINVIGQEIYSGQTTAEQGINTLNIDLRKFHRGVYIVSLRLAGEVQSKRLIVE
jgi:subtilisin-like proprotein convertase family protein